MHVFTGHCSISLSFFFIFTIISSVSFSSPGVQEQDPSTGEQCTPFLHLQVAEQFTPYAPAGHGTAHLEPWRIGWINRGSECKNSQYLFYLVTFNRSFSQGLTVQCSQCFLQLQQLVAVALYECSHTAVGWHPLCFELANCIFICLDRFSL